GQDIEITEEGVYVLQGTAANVTIRVVVEDENAKVQIVLDGVSIINESAPAIYVLSADKVFITTAEGTTNTLKVTGTFVADGDTNLDGVIFSKDDLVFNGLGTLVIESTDHGIVSKDGLKVTGGTYEITTTGDCIKAHDYIEIADGTFKLTGNDTIEAKDDDDDTIGYVYILGGTFHISASDDGIHGTTYLEIDGGIFDITASEGLEATYVQLNGGDVTISASDDGINAAQKSTSVTCRLEFNGGNYGITMGQGDTDGVDVNGDLYITGGAISVTGQSAFDYDGQVYFTGGTVIVNGQQVTTITNQFMGGPGGGMMGGPGQGGPWG
ncbi:MAG: carbohydrate-binding domain-containing protein, partial [Firmicutes bacterium]|nr:carbohydrate-binding domain-containing protein [Bacillota bacterium]